MVVERARVADVVQTKSFVKLRITRRIAGRRLDVSEGVRGRGGDREEEAYSASRHLRRTQSGPAAGAGSRAKRDGVGLPSRSVGGPTRGPTRRLFWASILFASVYMPLAIALLLCKLC